MLLSTCCTQGIDARQAYKEKDASTILAHIRPKEVKCSFFGRVCKTTQKLKAHIRSHHLRSATYKCPVCNKRFGDPYALSQHKKLHEEGGKKYLCAMCGKGFVTKSQVNEHSKRHQQERVSCAYCTKSLADKKSLQDHHKVCPQCPHSSQQSQPQTEEQVKPHKCDYCYRRYVHKKDLMCYTCSKHKHKL